LIMWSEVARSYVESVRDRLCPILVEVPLHTRVLMRVTTGRSKTTMLCRVGFIRAMLASCCSVGTLTEKILHEASATKSCQPYHSAITNYAAATTSTSWYPIIASSTATSEHNTGPRTVFQPTQPQNSVG